MKNILIMVMCFIFAVIPMCSMQIAEAEAVFPSVTIKDATAEVKAELGVESDARIMSVGGGYFVKFEDGMQVYVPGEGWNEVDFSEMYEAAKEVLLTYVILAMEVGGEEIDEEYIIQLNNMNEKEFGAWLTNDSNITLAYALRGDEYIYIYMMNNYAIVIDLESIKAYFLSSSIYNTYPQRNGELMMY